MKAEVIEEGKQKRQQRKGDLVLHVHFKPYFKYMTCFVVKQMSIDKVNG